MEKNIVIIGATSAIASAMAKQLADQNHHFFLIARDAQRLQAVAEGVETRSHHPCQTMLFDALDFNQIPHCVSTAVQALEKIDLVIIAHGTLPNQMQCQFDFQKSITEFQINATSYIGIATAFAQQLKKQQSGTMVLFSSCAGDRGRASNYLYGAAKAAIFTFAAGLRASLLQEGVHVMTVKPGFVDTPMTKDFKKGFLWAKPEQIARRVIKAIDRKKPVVYAPFFWRYIMFIIRCLPECMMRRL